MEWKLEVICLFVSRVGVGAGGTPFAWRIESVFAEFPKVLLSTMVCAQVPRKPRTPSSPHRCIGSLNPKTNLRNLRRYYRVRNVAVTQVPNDFDWKVRPSLIPLVLFVSSAVWNSYSAPTYILLDMEKTTNKILKAINYATRFGLQLQILYLVTTY